MCCSSREVRFHSWLAVGVNNNDVHLNLCFLPTDLCSA